MNRRSYASLWSNAYGAAIFVVSLQLITFYDAGDQLHYLKYWDLLPNSDFIDAYQNSIFYLGSAEPGYAAISYIASTFISKDYFVAAANYLLAFLLVHWMHEKRVSNFIILFSGLNFYVLVLMFPAERLKIAIILYLLGARYKGSLFFFILTAASHVSTTLLIATKYLANAVAARSKKLLTTNAIKTLGSLAVIALVVAIGLKEHIITKLDAYGFGEKFSALGVLKTVVFISLAALYSKPRYTPVLSGIPMLIATALIGPERVAMFAYFMFMYYGLQYKNGLNAGVILTTIYFTVRGIDFISIFITYGNGFYFESIK